MRKLAAVAVIGAIAGSAFAGEIKLYSNRSSIADAAALNAASLSKNGVAAAAGTYWSEVQNNAGNTTESNTAAGFSVSRTATTNGFRLADDFTVNAVNGAWNIDAIQVYAYQTGATGATSPFDGGNMKLWSGRPGDAGSVMVGETSTIASQTKTIRALNQAGTGSVDGIVNRIFNTTTPAPGTAPGTTRPIWMVKFGSIVWGAGAANGGIWGNGSTLWIDYDLKPVNNGAAFNPSTTHEGVRGVAGANARQFSVASGLWIDVIDAGNPAAAPDFIQDLPFIVCGTDVVPEPATMTALALGLGALVARRRRK